MAFNCCCGVPFDLRPQGKPLPRNMRMHSYEFLVRGEGTPNQRLKKRWVKNTHLQPGSGRGKSLSEMETVFSIISLYIAIVFGCRIVAKIKNRDKNARTLFAILNPLLAFLILAPLKSLQEKNIVENHEKSQSISETQIKFFLKLISVLCFLFLVIVILMIILE